MTRNLSSIFWSSGMANFLIDKAVEEIAPGSIFVCWASFESRSSQIFDRLQDGVTKTVFISEQHEYPFCESFSDHRQLSAISDVRVVDRDNQIQIFDALNEILLDSVERPIWIDITCFPREYISVLVLCLGKLSDGAQLRVSLLYSLAADYAFESEMPDEKWLVKGIKSVTTTLGYRGQRRPGAKLILVGMLGFDIDRFLAISKEVEPDAFLLGVGGTLVTERAWMEEKNRRAVNELKSYLNFLGEFVFSCDNVSDCYRDVENALRNFSADDDVTIINLNNKVSVIATSLFARDYRKVRLCHSAGVVYNWRQYSRPSGEVSIMNVRALLS
jgi:hypothetical protein